MDFIKKYFNGRNYGYYVALSALALSIVAVIIYAADFGAKFSDYFSVTPVWLPFLGLAGFLGLSLDCRTAKYAPVFAWACVFLSLLIYANAVYMYFAEVFYSGVNAETLAMLSPSFGAGSVFYLLGAIVCNVAIWLKQTKDNAKAD